LTGLPVFRNLFTWCEFCVPPKATDDPATFGSIRVVSFLVRLALVDLRAVLDQGARPAARPGRTARSSTRAHGPQLDQGARPLPPPLTARLHVSLNDYLKSG
jgi:hypothetical protein